MPQWMQDLFAGWPIIRANLPTFFVIAVLIFGAVWWLMDWRYGAIVASKNGQIEFQLKDIEKSRVNVIYENAMDKQLARIIFDAFKEAGWTQASLVPGSGLGDGIVVGWSSRAVAIGNVLETTARLKGVWAKDTEKEIRDLVIAGV